MELFDLNIHFPVTDPTWIFFLVLIIILFAPMILGRLRIPHIIGMILAGVVVGKYGFNILERDSSFELFGKVGLYYIMFLAGLEMDMDDFKKNRTKGLVFGMFTFLIPMGLGIWSSMSMLNYGFLTSVFAGQYVCQSHLDCLSYYQSVWLVAATDGQYHYWWYGGDCGAGFDGAGCYWWYV